MASYLDMDEVPFKPQAYEKAALALEGLSEPVEQLYTREGLEGLQKIPGVGQSLAQQIEQYITGGVIKEYEEYRVKMPVDLEGLTQIEGIGPKTVKELYKKLGIKTIEDLEQAAKSGNISAIKGFGKKTEQNILQGIQFVKSFSGRTLLGYAYPLIERTVEALRQSGLVKSVTVAGSVRRMKETIGDIDILAVTDTPEKLLEYFVQNVPHVKVQEQGSVKASVRTVQGVDIDLRAIPERSYGAALLYFTGSKEHNVKLRTYAEKMGLKLNEYGVFERNEFRAAKTEEEVYRVLEMDYIEPELREDTGEIEAAQQHTLPHLVPYGALKGDLQVQTNWTDGSHSIEQMARAAREAGLEYIAITDHTKDLAMTHGLDERRLQMQMEEIDRLNGTIPGITILKGAEVNIRRDGSLDIEDEMLAKLDVVGVSVHSLFKMSKRDMTERIIRAMRNPYVDIVFHPTGRLINRRSPYEVDIDAIIQTAKETGTLLEINAFPDRLDLKDVYIKKAVDAGVKMVIDSDAHHTEHFSVLSYGVGQARRGWAGAADILNTESVDAFLAAIKHNATKK